jgi:hypothetical protein
MESNEEYFSRRAREELFAAIRSADHRARRAHLDMARRYEDLVRIIDLRESEPAPSIAPNPEPIAEQIKIYV